MMALFLNAVLLSLDSLVVSLALSPLVQCQAQRWRWATWFGLCDGIAVMIGSTMGGAGWGAPFAHRAVPVFVLCCGLYCLVAAFWNKFRADPRLALALPVLMSFDNFAYGAGIDPQTSGIAARAVFFGLASFSLAMLGLLLGGIVSFSNLRARERSAGCALTAACLVFSFC
jgi:putative Mn2+ efflux pump MntP